MPGKTVRKTLFPLPALLCILLLPITGVSAQSLGEAARRARAQPKSTRKVLTNEDLRRSVSRRANSSAPGELPDLDATSLSFFAATPMPVVRAMLEMAGVQPGETVYDLGSGDGRIVIMAAERFQARGIGVEMDKDLVQKSRAAVTAKGLDDRVEIQHADALAVDVSSADVVTLYLLPDGLELLRPHLEQSLRAGARVVSHRNPIENWTAERVEKSGEWLLYLYRIR